MKCRFLVLFFLPILLIGCRTLHVTPVSDEVVEERLPSVDLVFDDASFSTVYPNVSYSNVYSSSNYGRYFSTTVSVGNTNSYGSKHINRYKKIFEEQMNGCVFEKYGECMGKVVLSLNAGKYRDDGGALAYLSGTLLFIPNLFGMPFYEATGKIQLKLSVYNKNNDLLGEYYSETYEANAYMGIAGYSTESEVEYEVTYDLFVKALNDIQSQLVNDSERLRRGLENRAIPAGVENGFDRIQYLRELKELLDEGVLTEDEFNREKNRVLSGGGVRMET